MGAPVVGGRGATAEFQPRRPRPREQGARARLWLDPGAP